MGGKTRDCRTQPERNEVERNQKNSKVALSTRLGEKQTETKHLWVWEREYKNVRIATLIAQEEERKNQQKKPAKMRFIGPNRTRRFPRRGAEKGEEETL